MRSGIGSWALVSLVGACGFQAPVSDATAPLGPPWWDDGFASRRRLTVTTGSLRPDKGYAGYTVRLAPFDARALTGAAPSCDDLRVVAWDGARWTELARHLLGCGTEAADLRFALPVDVADGATYDGAYLYYGNAAAGPPAAADGTAVYLWWDPATRDRTADYLRGRMDPWIDDMYSDTLRWDPQGYYTYDTGNDSESSYRRAVDERDVLVEVSLFHTACHQSTMQAGVCARGIIAAGDAATEVSDHYYCSLRAHHPSCINAARATFDGKIVEGAYTSSAFPNPSDPPPIVPSQWRTQALGVFGAGPTQLRFWDADLAWTTLAAPPSSALLATGSDSTDKVGRGFAGFKTSQDQARMRDLVIRRYVEPEPTVTHGDEQAR